MVGLVPHPLRPSTTLLAISSAALVVDRMAMAGSGGLGFFEGRDARYECRSSDANRERFGALTKVNAALLSRALWVDRDAEGKIAWFGQDNLHSIKLVVNDELIHEILFDCPTEIRQKSGKKIKSL